MTRSGKFCAHVELCWDLYWLFSLFAGRWHQKSKAPEAKTRHGAESSAPCRAWILLSNQCALRSACDIACDAAALAALQSDMRTRRRRKIVRRSRDLSRAGRTAQW
jgi:hypothetical protein